jgi:hypothetical protein
VGHVAQARQHRRLGRGAALGEPDTAQERLLGREGEAACRLVLAVETRHQVEQMLLGE